MCYPFYIFSSMKEHGIITMAILKAWRRRKPDSVAIRHLKIYFNIEISKNSWVKRKKYLLWNTKN